jgi:hypothetical protein
MSINLLLRSINSASKVLPLEMDCGTLTISAKGKPSEKKGRKVNGLTGLSP